MINRTRLFPILLSVAVSFAASPLPSHAEPGVPNDTSNAAPAVATPSPAPAVTSAPTPTITGSTLTPATTPSAPGDRPATYTVVSGDSLWTVAQKFGCTVTALKKANNLTKKNLKPGQVLKIPPAKTKSTKSTTAPSATTTKPDASTTPKKSTHHKVYAQAQPVQDFDVPASTFASCPVPDPASVPDKPVRTVSIPDTTPTSAPVAQLVSPAELDEDAPKTVVIKTKPAPVVASAKIIPAPSIQPTPDHTPTSTPISSSKPSGHNSFFASIFSSPAPTPSTDVANRFMQEARDISNLGLEYDESWRPPGESHAWAMDCSNTSRYIYKVTTGLDLPRTASDQYYYLHLQNKAWDVPLDSNGFADSSYLREKLKVGDLLFWENTYRPERQPPITHVMIFLGTNEKGQWIMVGSQSSRGLHNHRGGGPDIYVFDPQKPSGGYTTWLGLVRHKGRFCAFGRPLEADPTKLSVAAN